MSGVRKVRHNHPQITPKCVISYSQNPKNMDDSPEPEKKKRSSRFIFMRCLFSLLFILFSFLSLSFTLVYVAVFLEKPSISSPISVPSHCKIVSSSVDIRSSKVCELGLLNYKAKNVFYPYERKKFRCRYDYYWASVFKVEYIDHSGQARTAFAEAPNEALPSDCRPNFGAAWLAKDKFKVNETYDCWYTLGISTVNIYHDSFSNCQSKDPSMNEMLRRYAILSKRMLTSMFSGGKRAKYRRMEATAGAFAGFLTSMISVAFLRLLYQSKSCLTQIFSATVLPLLMFIARIKRVCFFVAYFSFVCFLFIRYGESLGIFEIFRVQ